MKRSWSEEVRDSKLSDMVREGEKEKCLGCTKRFTKKEYAPQCMDDAASGSIRLARA
jgi:hypothetical protein